MIQQTIQTPPQRKHWEPRQQDEAVLTFAPLAWLKLMYFLHAGDTEIGGFGISSEHDVLYVQDFVTVRQFTSVASVEFDDDAVSDYFDRCVDAGLPPSRFARIWMHTHPGESPNPSTVDEETFERVFGPCDWSLMFIVGRTGRTYARLAFNAGPGGQVTIPVAVDWAAVATLSDDQWQRLPAQRLDWVEEYARNVQPDQFIRLPDRDPRGFFSDDLDDPFDKFDIWPRVIRRPTRPRNNRDTSEPPEPPKGNES